MARSGASSRRRVLRDVDRGTIAVHRATNQRLETHCNLDRYGFPFAWEQRTQEAILAGRVVACALEA